MLKNTHTKKRRLNNAYLLGMVTATAILGLANPVLADENKPQSLAEAIEAKIAAEKYEKEIETWPETREIKRVIHFSGLDEEDQIPDIVQTATAHREVTVNHKTLGRNETMWQVDNLDEVQLPKIDGYICYAKTVPAVTSTLNIGQFDRPTFAFYHRLPGYQGKAKASKDQPTSIDQGVQTAPVKITDQVTVSDAATNTPVEDEKATVTTATDTADLITSRNVGSQYENTSIDEGCGDDRIDDETLAPVKNMRDFATQTVNPVTKDTASGDEVVTTADNEVGNDPVIVVDQASQTEKPAPATESTMTTVKELVDAANGDEPVSSRDQATQAAPEQITESTETSRVTRREIGVGDAVVDLPIFIDEGVMTVPPVETVDEQIATEAPQLAIQETQTAETTTEATASQTQLTGSDQATQTTISLTSTASQTMDSSEHHDAGTQTTSAGTVTVGTMTVPQQSHEVATQTEPETTTTEQATNRDASTMTDQPNEHQDSTTQTTSVDYVNQASETDQQLVDDPSQTLPVTQGDAETQTVPLETSTAAIQTSNESQANTTSQTAPSDINKSASQSGDASCNEAGTQTVPEKDFVGPQTTTVTSTKMDEATKGPATVKAQAKQITDLAPQPASPEEKTASERQAAGAPQVIPASTTVPESEERSEPQIVTPQANSQPQATQEPVSATAITDNQEPLRLHERFKAAQDHLTALEAASPLAPNQGEGQLTTGTLPKTGNKVNTVTSVVGLLVTAIVAAIGLVSLRKKR